MNIESIREFVVLAETRNFGETADRLFTAQSTISKHLKQLELELGTPLFTRTSRRVELNRAGEIFLPYARTILTAQYQYTTALHNYLDRVTRTLTIGSIPVMAQYGITDIIARFSQENKRIRLDVLEAEASELLPALKGGKCELAFVRESPDLGEEYVKIPYVSDQLAALIPAAHPLAKTELLSLRQLKEEPLLFIKEKTFLYELCTQACEQAGFCPNVVFSSHRIENITDLVGKGMGIALLMERQIPAAPGDKWVVRPVLPAVTSRISLVYLKEKPVSETAKHFLRYVEN